MAINELDRCDKTADMFAPVVQKARMFRAKFNDNSEKWILAFCFERAVVVAHELDDESIGVKDVFEAYQEGQVSYG